MTSRLPSSLLMQAFALLCATAVVQGAGHGQSAPGHGVHGSPIARNMPRSTRAECQGVAFIAPPTTMLGPIDEAGLMLEDEHDEVSDPPRFGVQRQVDLSLDDGLWMNVTGGRLWRCRIEALGALNTRLHLSGLDLETGQQVIVHSPGDASSLVGPVEGRGERGDGEVWGVFAQGAAAEIEWFVPEGQSVTQLPFTRVEYAHGYRDVLGPEERQLLAPIGCRNEPACFPGWENLSNATGRLLYTRNGANRACSGQLTATTAADETPYFSTAYHCIGTQTEAASANVRFFFRTDSCEGLLNLGQAAIGTDLVATHPSSDSTLLMIRGALPSGVHWIGWTSTLPANGTPILSIHHPSAFQQAISFGSKTGTGTACNPVISACTVNWTTGTTEPGSSGCALVEQTTGLMFGVLTCGTSACNNPGGWDAYGRWDLAVNNGGFGALLGQGSDDAYEPDDTCATAATLIAGAHAGLVLKRLSPDWYAVAVESGGRMIVQTSYTHADGDVDFRVWDACAGTTLVESLDDASGDSFTCINTTSSDTLLLEAFLSTDTRADYALDIHVLPACAEDLDGDGEVGSGDLSVLLLAFGPCESCREDLDGDNEVSGADISLALLAFGECP